MLPEERLLVGFSGGRDSVALVELLLEAGWKRLVLCHVDHGIREESGADALWSAAYAERVGLEFRVRRVDVTEYARTHKVGMEEAGRELRYAFFKEVAEELGIPRVLLAHHADDQVETVLFRFLRGSGSAGLGGMAAISFREEGGLWVLRPMLGIWRREIDAFAVECGMQFREDASNAETRWTRNRIRHDLIPYLESVMQRPVKEAIWRNAELLRAENEWGELLEEALGECAEELVVSDLKGLPLALRRRRVLRWIRCLGVGGVGFAEVESILALLSNRNPARINLPGNCFVRRRAGRIFLERPTG